MMADVNKLRVVFYEYNTVWAICEQDDGLSLWVAEIGDRFEPQQLVGEFGFMVAPDEVGEIWKKGLRQHANLVADLRNGDNA